MEKRFSHYQHSASHVSVSLLTKKIIPLLMLLTSQTLSQKMVEMKHGQAGQG